MYFRKEFNFLRLKVSAQNDVMKMKDLRSEMYLATMLFKVKNYRLTIRKVVFHLTPTPPFFLSYKTMWRKEREQSHKFCLNFASSMY